MTPSNHFFDLMAKRPEKQKLDRDVAAWLAIPGNAPKQIPYGVTTKTVEDELNFELKTQMTIEAKEALARRNYHGRHHNSAPPVDFRSSVIPTVD